MSGRVCSPCGIGEHGFCRGNFDWYVGGYASPALTSRCGCTCCPAGVRGVCDRCGQPCGPATAAAHRTCHRPHIPYQPTAEET
ncbi:hypothetical protein Salbus254_6345 [Streptomyces albidoflavus]|nr:hypothetical protein Salbus254_6345 [Streptomyces albidoflavus]